MFESYAQYEYFLASSQLILAMLGMGALLTPSDFVTVARTPRPLLVGLTAQIIAVPLVAWAIGGLLPVEPGIAAGLVLVAAVPGGTMSNVITYLGRGNIALSISLTAITTIGALATTPLLLRLLIGALLPADFEMPIGKVAGEIGMSLLLPLFCGMFIGARIVPNREIFSKWCIRGSLAVIGCMIVGAAGSGRLDVTAYGVIGPLAIVALSIGAQLAATGSSRLARLQGPDRLALEVEVTVRNTNLALLVKASVFPAQTGQADPIGDGMFFVALLYGGVAIFVALPPVLLHRTRSETVAKETG